MLPYLIIIGISLPIVEIVLLVYLSSWIGFWWTIGIIGVTGILGIILFRIQGRLVKNRLQRILQDPTKIGDTLADGALIFFAAGLLLAPGVITDALGLLILFPLTRGLFKSIVHNRFRNHFQSSAFNSSPFGGGFNPFEAMAGSFGSGQPVQDDEQEFDADDGNIIDGFLTHENDENQDPDELEEPAEDTSRNSRQSPDSIN